MSIYNEIYNLIMTFVYDGQTTDFGTLVCTLMATIGCIFVVALPFVLVWKVIKLIVGD